jgi:glycosyltransferase involved in cell wall biosynthesis/SAM-dependent methyltransferase
MKFLIDLQSLQTTSAERGIGRYSTAITQAIIAAQPNDEFFILLNDSGRSATNKGLMDLKALVGESKVLYFPLPDIGNPAIYLNDEQVRLAKIIRERFIEAIKPDVVLITSLFEFDAVSAIPNANQRSYFCAVILYDLIPLTNPKIYLGNAYFQNWYQDRLIQLKQADAILSISDFVRKDAIQRIQLPEDLCCNISAASNLYAVFNSDALLTNSQSGLTKKPYILYVGGFDKRKNVEKLVKAYSQLSKELRRTYRLKLAGGIQEYRKIELLNFARSKGVSEEDIEITGYIDDQTLVQFYKGASLFVFPSEDEGFGLPPLEAMSFGVPTIVSDRASLPEVVGNSEALFDLSNSQSLVKKITTVLSDEQFRQSLIESGLQQSKLFSWDHSAKRALEFIFTKKSSVKLGEKVVYSSFKDFLKKVSAENNNLIHKGDTLKLSNLLARGIFGATKIEQSNSNIGLPKELMVKEFLTKSIPNFSHHPMPYVFSSGLCREQHFHMPLYTYWCKVLGEKPRFHRKLWEFVFICQTLLERGYLKPGNSAIGFGVGKEPLVSYFASKGVQVLATDLDFSKAEELGWVTTDQHSNNLDALNEGGICDPDEFVRLASFKNVDMNAIPSDIGTYDFCWSSCAFEHLGSIRKGLDFVKNSVRLLKPGGIAVHTTEFNLTSNTNTLDNNPSFVIFRRCDIELLVEELSAEGYEVEPIDFTAGEDELERYIDMPPYLDEPHLRLQLAGEFVSTSIGLIIRAPANPI